MRHVVMIFLVSLATLDVIETLGDMKRPRRPEREWAAVSGVRGGVRVDRCRAHLLHLTPTMCLRPDGLLCVPDGFTDDKQGMWMATGGITQRSAWDKREGLV